MDLSTWWGFVQVACTLVASRRVGKMAGLCPYTGQYERALQRALAAATVPLPLGPYDLLDSMVVEVSLVGKDATLSLWLVPVGETQCRPLGFWSEAMPSG